MDIAFLPLEKPENKHGLKGSSLFKQSHRDKEILRIMNEDTYEELIASWAFYCLKNNGMSIYEDVLRIGGAGDGGVDIIAYYNQAEKSCDIYQCKHYDHPISRSDVIAELGKFLYHIYNGYIPSPHCYYLMAPLDLSGRFHSLYTNADKLKENIKASWAKDISKRIESNNRINLEDGLLDFVESFDYSIFKFYSSDKLINDLLKQKHVYYQYFGVKVAELECTKLTPPPVHDDYEKKYIDNIIDAYNDVNGTNEINTDNVTDTNFSNHFERSRDEFWMAESVKKMSEENCPGDCDEFNELKDDMYDHVADTYEEDHENAFKKLKEVTGKAASLPIREQRIISGELSSRELKGVCFHLSNENRLIWKKDKRS